MSLVKDINELDIDDTSCIIDEGNIMIYTESSINSLYYEYNLVFNLQDSDKFERSEFDRLKITSYIDYIVRKYNAQIPKFIKIRAFKIYSGQFVYDTDLLCRDQHIIKANNFNQLTIKDLQSTDRSLISNIKYYKQYQLDLFDKYIEQYELSQGYK